MNKKNIKIKNNSRLDNSIRNALFGMAGQIISYIFSFILRLVFVKTLNIEYLGINGLFTNIITVLSITEAGFGTAIIFHLYRPIANGDKIKIKSLLNFYRIVYRIIGVIILILGISITPFLQYIIKEMPNIKHLRIYYIMFVLQSATTYFFSYKRSYIIAKQNNYIVTTIHYMTQILFLILEGVVLLITRNYTLYLVLFVLQSICENLIISFTYNRMYADMRDIINFNIGTDEKKLIWSDVSSLMMHQVGSIAVNATDNIIISKYIGIMEVGLYSNYSLLINACSAILGQIFTGFTASLGNMNVASNNEHKYTVFSRMYLANFWIYCICTVGLFCLLNDFILLVFGEPYLIKDATVPLITISFYLNGMRKTILLYKSTMGLFKQDRYKAIIEALINLVVSIVLAKQFGLQGVFLGTIISSLTTSFWIEPFVVFRYGLNKPFRIFAIKTIKNFIMLFICTTLTYLLKNLITGVGILDFVLKLFVCVIVPNILLVVMHFKNSDAKYLIETTKLYSRKLIRRA